MSRNRGFGRRVRQAREDAGLSRRTLGRLADIEVFRIEMLETAQIDDTDFGHHELTKLADVLDRPLPFLINGEAPRTLIPAGTIAQRSVRHAIQLPLDLDSPSCPHCQHSVRGIRCDNCGRSTD
jgi:transcriptional regulator with XRE-family HTH domain